MLVKYVAVPIKRTPKKVEITLSRSAPAKRNVIKLNARVAETISDEIPAAEAISATDEIIDDAAVEAVVDTAVETVSGSDDNLDGIVPVYEFVSDDDYADSEESFEEAHVSIADVDADLEELENDLISQISDLENADCEDSSVCVEEHSDNNIVQRHFVRDDTGELYKSDDESADGHEVACYDNTGKLKRACGVIRKGSAAFADNSDDDDDGFSQAVSDMFSN